MTNVFVLASQFRSSCGRLRERLGLAHNARSIVGSRNVDRMWAEFCVAAGLYAVIRSAITLGWDAVTDRSAAYRLKHPILYRAEWFAWAAIFAGGAITTYVYESRYHILAAI